jgi:Ca2+-binding RTX toxin-like protein
VSGYDAVVAVGPGRLAVSGSSDAGVYGDIWSQEIAGGRGDDFLSGGGGDDVLTGGNGSDTFELGFAGTTVITDLTASDQLAFDLFGVSTVDQLVGRIAGVSQGAAGLRVQFDTFAVELVGYSDLGQIQSGISL